MAHAARRPSRLDVTAATFRRSASARWRSRRSTWPPPTRRSRPAASTRSRPAIRKVVLPDGEDTGAGWGKPKRTARDPGRVAYEVTRILEENIQYGTGTGANYGPARGRQDRHDRGALRRLVLRLHAEPLDDGLGRLPERRRSRWTNVHGIAVAGGTFPAQIWRCFMSSAIGRARLGRRSPSRPTGREYRDRPFERGTYGARSATSTSSRSTETHHDDDHDDDHRDAPAAAAPRRAHEAATTPMRPRRPPRDPASTHAAPPAAGGSVALLARPGASRARSVAASARLWPERRSAAHGGSAGARLGAALPGRCGGRASPPTSARLVLLRSSRTLAAGGRRARGRDPARCRSPRRCCSRPTRGRTGATAGSPPCTTRNPYRAVHGRRVPGRSRVRRTSARPGATRRRLRAGVHARVGAGRARRGLVGGRGRVDLQGARGARRARVRARSRLALARDRPFALALRRLEPAARARTSPAAATTTRWMTALVPRRARARRAPAAGSWPAPPGRRRSSSSGSRSCCPPPAGARGARERRVGVGHLGFALAAVVLAALATLALRLDWLRALRAARAQRRRADEVRAAASRSSSSASRASSPSALAGARARRPGYAWLLREAVAGRPRLGLTAVLLLATTPWLVVWYLVWAAAARRRRRRPARAVARARLCRVPAAADDPALAPPEDEDAVLGEDERASAGRARARRAARARPAGLEAVEVGRPACVDGDPVRVLAGAGS